MKQPDFEPTCPEIGTHLAQRLDSVGRRFVVVQPLSHARAFLPSASHRRSDCRLIDALATDDDQTTGTHLVRRPGAVEIMLKAPAHALNDLPQFLAGDGEEALQT